MAVYSFSTIWRFEAPIQAVWDAIFHSEDWPSWWNGVENVFELEPGDQHRLGSLWRCTWRSRLSYRLTFDIRISRVEPPHCIEGLVSRELEGTGRWHLSEQVPLTQVRHVWDIRTTKGWMNVLAPIARPVFQWNHDLVMRQGGEGLARLLNTRLLRPNDFDDKSEATYANV